MTPGLAGEFEVDEGSESDRSDLEALIDAAAPLEAGWSAQVGSALDLAETTQMWAVERYVGAVGRLLGDDHHPDEPNNYFLHSDAAGHFSMLPWGADIGWAARQPFVGPASGVLFQRCQLDEVCLATYQLALAHLRESLPAADLDELATSTAAMLAPWQQLDPRREQTLDEIAAGVEAVRAFVAVRPSDLESFLYGTPSAADTPLTLKAAAIPESSITDGPRARTRSRSVRFAFGSEMPGAGFGAGSTRTPSRRARHRAGSGSVWAATDSGSARSARPASRTQRPRGATSACSPRARRAGSARALLQARLGRAVARANRALHVDVPDPAISVQAQWMGPTGRRRSSPKRVRPPAPKLVP